MTSDMQANDEEHWLDDHKDSNFIPQKEITGQNSLTNSSFSGNPLESPNLFEMQTDEILYSPSGDQGFATKSSFNDDEVDWLQQTSGFSFDKAPSKEQEPYQSTTLKTLFPKSSSFKEFENNEPSTLQHADQDENLEFMDFTSASNEPPVIDQDEGKFAFEIKQQKLENNDIMKACEELNKMNNETFEEIINSICNEYKIPEPSSGDDPKNIWSKVDFEIFKSLEIPVQKETHEHDKNTFFNPLGDVEKSLLNDLNNGFNLEQLETENSILHTICITARNTPPSLRNIDKLKSTINRRLSKDEKAQLEIPTELTIQNQKADHNQKFVQLGSQLSSTASKKAPKSLSSDSSLQSLEIDSVQPFESQLSQDTDLSPSASPKGNVPTHIKSDPKQSEKNIVSRFVSSITFGSTKTK